MKQKIAGFLKDMEQHWVAKLECGHVQHVRHDPPWMEREWVTSEEGRQSRIGRSELNCVLCDEQGAAVAQAVLAEAKKALADNYESAGISGLCAEGRWEAALGSFQQLPITSIIESALRKNPIPPRNS